MFSQYHIILSVISACKSIAALVPTLIATAAVAITAIAITSGASP